MAERVFIGVAWPYASGPLHLGHIAGVYLPADIFARYHRSRGNRVLMVSGSDQHGTPVTVRAEEEGKTPAEIAQRYHNDFLGYWEELGISFDFYTGTETEHHIRVTQEVFLRLLEGGHLYRDSMRMPFCETDQRFLPDRYVGGTCPYCGSDHARGDQCDECGKPLNPEELLDAKCAFCGATPQVRETEHFFLRLSAFQEKLSRWVGQQNHWRPNVLNLTRRYLGEGLRDRAITRDIEWGVPVPVPGFEKKRIYVWIEAVIGYLSASKEWARRSGDAEAWRDFWQDGAKAYYFLGKDNIPFHTIIWPAILMAYGGLNLPYDIPANEYLTIEARQFSKSRAWAVWVSDYLERYEPDPLRYYLSANMPETSDSDFSWAEFVARNNNELVATFGNLVHRSLTFAYRNFDGAVPAPGDLDGADRALLEQARATLDSVGQSLASCRFREGIRTAMGLAQEANRYLEATSPWKVLAQDRKRAATSLHTVLTAVSALRTVLYPYLPFSMLKLHHLLGEAGTPEQVGWRLAELEPGRPLPEPEPLYAKLDEKVVEEERARMVGS